MCGIAGVVSSDPEALRAVGAMTTALRHRGPDDEGYLLAQSGTGRAASHRGRDTRPEVPDPPLPDSYAGYDVALGHRRLSILDLSPAGHGPMPFAGEQYWVTYNGEIYNYRELRDELLALGHTFRSGTDTEVLLAAYAQWGHHALHRFNGMFAFALYDFRERVLFCARDRFGVKPFYYHDGPSFFAFASEIKGLLAHPRVPRRVHEPSLVGFLVRGALDEGEDTFWGGIRALPPGHCLTVEVPAGRPQIERWYTLPSPATEPADPRAFRDLLEDAVRLRLRSDVEVGTCLSGGLDSSAIVALTARLHQGGRRAVSVVYREDGLDESPHIRTVVQATGVQADEITATSADLLRDLPALVRHQDEPIPSAGPYSHWRVMALASQVGLKVLLDGQGSDELLAGYHYQLGPFLAEITRKDGVAAGWRELRALSSITARPHWFLAGLGAYHLFPGLTAGMRTTVLGRFSTHRYVPARLLDRDLLARVGPPPGRRHLPRRTLAAERRADLTSASLPALLRYEDRNSMAFGLEARTPFLDVRLVEHALAFPARDLVKDGWTKAVLRESMKGLLPESVRLRRDKLGFATPETRWLTELAPHVREWLSGDSRAVRCLRPRALDGWLRDEDAALGRRPGLWRLVCAEHWLRYTEQAPRPAA